MSYSERHAIFLASSSLHQEICKKTFLSITPIASQFFELQGALQQFLGLS